MINFFHNCIVLNQRPSIIICDNCLCHSIGRKIFNYKEVLQDINVEEYPKNPLTAPTLLFNTTHLDM